MQVGEKPLRTVINPKQFISLQGHTIILRQLEIQSTSPNSVHVIHLIATTSHILCNASAS